MFDDQQNIYITPMRRSTGVSPPAAPDSGASAVLTPYPNGVRARQAPQGPVCHSSQWGPRVLPTVTRLLDS
jgi:hypothetical protein